MDHFLQTIATTSVSFVGKAAYSYAASLALKKIQSSLQGDSLSSSRASTAASTAQSNDEQDMLKNLEIKLSRKLSVILPVLDQIHQDVARGKEEAESIVALSKELQICLDKLAGYSQEASLGGRGGEASDSSASIAKMRGKKREQFGIVLDLLDEIIPLLQLHLTATRSVDTLASQSASSLSLQLSYSRLLKASAALVTGDAVASFAHTDSATTSLQVGPTIGVRLYTLFQGSARKDVPFTWKEEFLKGIVKVFRKSPTSSSPRGYFLEISEDLNDGRVHDDVNPFLLENGVFVKGAKRIVDISHLAKMFYTSAGALLSIEESRMPVLVLKTLSDNEQTGNAKPGSSSTPSTPQVGSKVEWLALELFLQQDDTDEKDSSSSSSSVDDEDDGNDNDGERVEKEIKNLSIADNLVSNSSQHDGKESLVEKSSLSQLCFLEYLIRLCALECQAGMSHTKVSDSLFREFFEKGNGRGVLEPAEILAKKKNRVVQGGSMESPVSTRKAGGKGLLDRFLGNDGARG